jgi:hypothetical protein
MSTDLCPKSAVPWERAGKSHLESSGTSKTIYKKDRHGPQVHVQVQAGLSGPVIAWAKYRINRGRVGREGESGAAIQCSAFLQNSVSLTNHLRLVLFKWLVNTF